MNIDTKTQILDAAENLMRSGGYENCSFREIAKIVGIKSASVHYHYPEKKDLAAAVVKRYRERFFENLELQGPIEPFECISKLFKKYEVIIKKDRKICLCVVLASQTSSIPENVQDEIQEFFRTSYKWVESSLLNCDYSKKEAAGISSMVISMLQGAIILCQSEMSLNPYREASQTLLQILEAKLSS